MTTAGAPVVPGRSRPLSGRRVLVPRPNAVDPIARAVEDAGGQAVTVGLTRTVPADDAVIDRALNLAAAAWVVFTSARTVTTLAARAQRAGKPLADRLAAAAATGTRLAAVGPATANALRGVGHLPHLLAPAPESARTLLQVFPAGDGRRVVLPCSALASTELADGLGALGWSVDRHDVYTTRTADLDDADRARLTEPWPDLVLLTASSSVRSLITLLGHPPEHVAVAVIGAPTQRAAREAGVRVDGVADEATPAGLVAAATRALRPRTPDTGADR